MDNDVSHDHYRRMQQLEKVVTVSANYTAKPEDDIIYVSSVSGVVVVTLPFANSGQHVIISRTTGTNNVVVMPQSGETINGAASQTISTSYSPLRLKAIRGTGYLGI